VEADAHRARGDLRAAGAAATAGLAQTSDWWSPRYAWPLLWLGARIEADRSTEARDRGLPAPAPLLAGVTADVPADVSPAGRAYRLLSEAEQRRRDGAAAVPAWREAVHAWEEAGDVWPLAYARFRLAEALCEDGDRSTAVVPLRAAAAAADALGARPLLDDVQALARRARLGLDEEPVPEVVDEDRVPFGLTDREREVLALVAAGRSNGQIATALFISPKTASVHVSNILAKLGVGGRVEAAAVAHRMGLTGGEG
jgi:DNA-binding CsgD family transcriptional regulator